MVRCRRDLRGKIEYRPSVGSPYIFLENSRRKRERWREKREREEKRGGNTVGPVYLISGCDIAIPSTLRGSNDKEKRVKR